MSTDSINFKNDIVYFNNQSLNLKKKPKTLKLFKLFIENSNKPISMNELISYVHADKNINSCSTRYLECLHKNTIKLISRARSTAKSLESEQNVQKIKWFNYHDDSWQLLKYEKQ